MTDRPGDGTDDGEVLQSECTNMDCSGEAEYAYWMPDFGHFSEVRSPEHDQLDDGDLAPFVCESCRDRMAASPHWDSERFANPREKLVTDGGAGDGPVCVEVWLHFDGHHGEDGDGLEFVEAETPDGESINLGQWDIGRGGSTLKFEVPERCVKTAAERCENCNGTGMVGYSTPHYADTAECPECGGQTDE